jgi:hypothetical protein
MYRIPDQPTTPEQWQVIAWAAILALVGIASCGFYFSFHVPPERVAAAQSLRHLSISLLALASLIYVIKRVITHFVS